MFRTENEVFDFDLIQIDLNTGDIQRIVCNTDFCKKVNHLVLRNMVRDYASTVGTHFFKEQGWGVVENYKTKQKKGKPDLIIEKEGISFYVEMKLFTDHLSLNQTLELIKKNGLVVFVVPKDRNWF